MTIRTIIVDDESLARRGLELRLSAYEDIEIISQCTNGREALEKITELAPDLVFMDIQMPGLSGFDVVKNIDKNQLPMIIFVTAFDRYAVDAFDAQAVDYVLKPIDDERLKVALDKVRRNIDQEGKVNYTQRLMDLIISITGESPATIEGVMTGDGPAELERYPERLAIKDAGEITYVPVKEILWVEAAGDYMCVHAQGKVHILRSTMKELEKTLSPKIFQRIHRSVIVNLKRVEKVCSHTNGEYHLYLDCGSRLKMSRSYKDKIKHFGS
ncbi:MAG: DNA-binding response regulator [Gammaproteobacteria bacterium]|nr:MAG: DNA-binding response regulator [Gammaproteobacteria bacterium]